MQVAEEIPSVSCSHAFSISYQKVKKKHLYLILNWFFLSFKTPFSLFTLNNSKEKMYSGMIEQYFYALHQAPKGPAPKDFFNNFGMNHVSPNML